MVKLIKIKFGRFQLILVYCYAKILKPRKYNSEAYIQTQIQKE